MFTRLYNLMVLSNFARNCLQKTFPTKHLIFFLTYQTFNELVKLLNFGAAEHSSANPFYKVNMHVVIVFCRLHLEAISVTLLIQTLPSTSIVAPELNCCYHFIITRTPKQNGTNMFARLCLMVLSNFA